MLIGSVLEKTDAESAWQLSADKTADWVRTCWQENEKHENEQWEKTLHENPVALGGLREEGFPGLVGLDYIFKWWGENSPDEPAGELDAIWKILDKSGAIACYRSWIKLNMSDFMLGVYETEDTKRMVNREAFRKAFLQWRNLFLQIGEQDPGNPGNSTRRKGVD